MTRLNLIMGASLLGLAMSSPAIAGSGASGYTPDLLPQNAQPGQCYARIKHGAQYATQSEIVVVEEGYESLQVAPAQLRAVQKSVKVKDESVRYVVRQPQYRTTTENVLTSPAYERLSVSAPRFETVTETMQVSGPRRVWKKGNPGRLAAQGYNVLSTANGGYGTSTVAGSGGAYARTGSHSGGASSPAYAANGGTQCGPTCEIWCLVEEPGESVSYKRKVMTEPARVVRTQVPPQYRSITKQVLADPGGVDTVPVPAQYRDISVKELVSPASVTAVNIAPKMGEVKTKTLVKPATYGWARVICNTGQVIGHSGPVNYPAASGQASGYSSSGSYASSGHSSAAHSGSGYSALGYEIRDPDNSGYSAAGHASGGHSANAYKGHSGITYGGRTSSRYSAKQPSALIYGSNNTAAPDYGISYDSPSAPRSYGGDGMNAHHSAH